MKLIIQYFRSLGERRLRERCVRYALKTFHQGDNGYHLPNIANNVYYYIKEGKLV
jgi:hypothetical protein